MDSKCCLSRTDDMDLDFFNLGKLSFLRGWYAMALPLLDYAANYAGYTNAFLFLAVLYRQGIPGTVELDESQASACFSRWRRYMEPGRLVSFGRYPQEKKPDAYKEGALPEPILWNVLEIQADRVLLLCQQGLSYSGGAVCIDLFSPAENALVQDGPFHLSRAQFQKYIVEQAVASVDILGSPYAAVKIAQEKGLECETKTDKDGRILSIRVKFMEWMTEEKRWGKIITDRYSAWAQQDGLAGPDCGKYDREQVVLRPAVWLGLKFSLFRPCMPLSSDGIPSFFI